MATEIITIAEIGKNFVMTEEEQSYEFLLHIAKEMVRLAKKVGANIAKFQIHTIEDEIHPTAHFSSPHFNHDRYKWVKRNTYPVSFWREIKEYCREIDIEFLATPMSRGAAKILNEEIGIDRWKIGSGDVLDFVMLDYIRESGKPVILSSGMSSLKELGKAYEFLCEKVKDISIMHCVSVYPCPLDCLNLGTIPFLKKQFPEATIGFSDHSVGIEGALMAVTLGAKIIEKHFTLKRDAWGPDHKVSLLPHEFFGMIATKDFPKVTPEAFGVQTKYLHHKEEQFRPVFHKGLYASRDIEIGEIFEPDMIYALRPKISGAMSSEEYPKALGAIAEKDYKKYEAINI